MLEPILHRPPIALYAKVLLFVWFVLLLPWLMFALMGTGMAFEDGKTLDAYYFLLSIWTYPILVSVAFFNRRRRPTLAWAPFVTVLLLVLDDVVFKLSH